MGHNPYFNRWFSAIYKKMVTLHKDKVTILILIDGFLQCLKKKYKVQFLTRHNPYFNRWFSAICTKRQQMGY